MSTLNPELKSLFIHVPKCAGTSMERVSWNKGSGHQTICDFAQHQNLAHLFKWAFVRQPWSRIESFYADSTESQKATAGNFERFIDILHEHRKLLDPDDFCWWQVNGVRLGELGFLERIHVYSQFSLLSLGGKLTLDFMGRFESIERDWNTVCDLLGAEEITLPHYRKQSREGSFRWTRGMRKKVANIYPRDFWS